MNKEPVEVSTSEEHAEAIKKAISSACRMLAIREHSKKQIAEKLAKKGFASETIQTALVYLIDENWLSESRFCSSFIRSKSAKGHGLMRIETELRQQNISQDCIGQTLLEDPVDWQNVCEQALLKKIRAYSMTDKKLIKQDFNRRVKLEKFLRYRGFSAEEIKTAVNRCLV